MSTFDAIRIKFILEKQKFQTGLYDARRQLASSTDAMRQNLDKLKLKHVEAFRAMKDSVPGLGNALMMLKNPYTIAAAGVLALAAGLNTAANKAAEFESNFRQLKNLNLDKSTSDYGALKGSIRDVSLLRGLDQKMVSTAFYDVQSVTGKYGREVADIVSTQGEFAQLMQANINNWVSGTAKAMANFGFGAEKLDEFNRSAFATVKVGVTTFDQLASVMSVYSGAAASAKQDFNTANKLLALFTVKTKSVDEAATLTKSLFNDFTKDATIKAMKKIGINMYDATGAIRQADDILLELQTKFKSLKSDADLIRLKNEFTGSEGLIAYIQAATDKSDQLKTSFEAFNQTELNLTKLRQNANDDYLLQLEKVNARTDVLISQLGDKILPFKIGILEAVNSILDLINDRFQIFLDIAGVVYDKGSSIYGGIWGRIKEDANGLFNFIQNPITGGGMGEQKKKLPSNTDYDYSKWTTPGSFNSFEPVKKTGEDTPIEQRSNNVQTGVNTVTESAKAARNLTVNIGSFISGGINTTNTKLQHMDTAEMEEFFNRMFLTMIRNFEMSQ